jgi:lysophospholipase L1-like esterase
VFVTQPALFGEHVHDHLEPEIDYAKIYPIYGVNGRLAWEILELYNTVTRQIGKQEQVAVIDLARELSHDRHYFYDLIHFSNEGAQQVAEILYAQLCPLLQERYGKFVTGDCQ